MKRIITASSRLAREFGNIHDSANYEKYENTFTEIYSILDKYAENESESVTVTFDKASPEDQRTLMMLAKSMQR